MLARTMSVLQQQSGPDSSSSPRIATDPKPGILSAHDVIATDFAILIDALIVASPSPREGVLAAESGQDDRLSILDFFLDSEYVSCGCNF